MELTKWEPFREIDDVFDKFARPLGWHRRFGQELAKSEDWAPRVDISETDKEFIIKAEIPEVSKENVKVTVENGILTLRGERKKEKEEKGKKFHRVERYYGCFSRSFTLPDNVDQSRIDASFKGGMLNLTVPKTSAQKPKSIEVEVK